jgi:hypothetical protein
MTDQNKVNISQFIRSINNNKVANAELLFKKLMGNRVISALGELKKDVAKKMMSETQKKNVNEAAVVKTLNYKGFEIKVQSVTTSFGTLFIGDNDTGEPYLNVPAFPKMDQAIAWSKKNIDQYIKDTED